MLPWLFGVLLLLNVALFLWGQDREQSREPELTPLPEGQYEILLLSEREPVGATQAQDADAADLAPTGHGELDVEVDTEIDPQPTEATPTDPPPISETAVGEADPPASKLEPEPQDGEPPTPRTDPAESDWPPSEPRQESPFDPETDEVVADAADDAVVADSEEAGVGTAELLLPDELSAEPTDDPADIVRTLPAGSPEPSQERSSDGSQ